MSSSSCPINASAAMVADASVVINLNATCCAREIIGAQHNRFVVTEQAFNELSDGVQRGHDDGRALKGLVDSGLVQLASLGEIGCRIYESLVDGEAVRTLDDGEAATIGFAHEAGGIALIDEKKARNLCTERFPNLRISSTADLLVHERVRYALGDQGQRDAILRALRDARMRVPSHLIDAVVELIGPIAAASCNSLPRTKRQ